MLHWHVPISSGLGSYTEWLWIDSTFASAIVRNLTTVDVTVTDGVAALLLYDVLNAKVLSNICTCRPDPECFVSELNPIQSRVAMGLCGHAGHHCTVSAAEGATGSATSLAETILVEVTESLRGYFRDSL